MDLMYNWEVPECQLSMQLVDLVVDKKGQLKKMRAPEGSWMTTVFSNSITSFFGYLLESMVYGSYFL